jgi:aryl-phospho-beta-D-glucosidase BglC (GH1 family)
LYINILCRKYEEENQAWMQHQPQKHKHHDLIGGDYFPKFEEWITNAVSDAKEEGQDETIDESELSKSTHIWAMHFSGMWAYDSDLRVQEKDKGKKNYDCVVSAEFIHGTEKKFYVGFIQEII